MAERHAQQQQPRGDPQQQPLLPMEKTSKGNLALLHTTKCSSTF